MVEMSAEGPQGMGDGNPALAGHGLPPARSSRKIGRNDPCPCGSGKKFKKCCLGKVA